MVTVTQRYGLHAVGARRVQARDRSASGGRHHHRGDFGYVPTPDDDD